MFGSGLRLPGEGFGFEVGLGFMVYTGVGFRGLGFRVYGVGFREFKI